MKICSSCKENKPLTDFYSYTDNRNKSPHSYKFARCKKCFIKLNNPRRRIYRKKQRGIKFSNAWFERKIDYLKWRCKKKGWAFDLKKEFINKIYGMPCYYCGLLEVPISIDRKDNGIGYLEENCVASCYLCNSKIKSTNFTFDEMIIIGNAFKEVYKNRLHKTSG